MFEWEYRIALHAMQGTLASSPGRGMSHGISGVVAGTWGIFSSYCGDGHSKLHFVQRTQDSCLRKMDTSAM